MATAKKAIKAAHSQKATTAKKVKVKKKVAKKDTVASVTATPRRAKIMVGSSVYGFEDQLSAIVAQLTTLGYEVLNYHLQSRWIYG